MVKMTHIEAYQEAFLLIAEYLPQIVDKNKHINIWYGERVKCVNVVGFVELFICKDTTSEAIKEKLTQFKEDLKNALKN